MKKSITILKRNSFIYDEKEYDFDRLDEVICLLKKDRKIIILEEELYVKHFDFNMKNNNNKINDFVEEKIEKEFPQNGDIVYDYDENKKSNTIAIYSMKGAKRIEKLSEGAKTVYVQPIQFVLREVLRKFFNSRIFDCNVLMKFREFYYYISFKEGLFYYGFVETNKEVIFNRIIENNDLRKIYIDNNISEYEFLKKKFQIIEVNIGDLVNEKIYKKQRFYS